MKICFITDNIFSLGGVQRVVSVLANELVNTHDVDILCVSDTYKIDRSLYNLNNNIKIDINSDLFKKNITSKILGKIGRILNDNTGVFNNKSTVKILKEIYFPKEIGENFIEYLNNKDYDVIIAVEGIFSILLGSISKKINAKTIGWQHNSYEAYFKTKKRYYWNQDYLFKEYINKLDGYIVLTNNDKEKMYKELNIDSIRIYNPLSFKSKLKSKCNNKNILFVGRLAEEQKGLDLLIKAFNKVYHKDNECRLIIVGDGPDKEKLNTLIDEFDIRDKVDIHPFTDKVQDYYLNSSLFVSSSRWEGFGLVITEAMECGLPVIAFDNSGPKEIINKDGENGILIPTQDVNLLAESILGLINDKERLKLISYNSKLRAKDFSNEIIMMEWNKLISQISDK